MYLAPQMRLAALGQQGQTLLPRQKRDRSSDFKNVTPERMQKAEEERRRYLERNNGVDKHNLADDIYNFMATQPGDTGHVTASLPQLPQDIMPKAIQDRRARMDIAPPTRPGGMESLSGSLGGQIRPSPYSAPQMPQMGGGFGGNQGMQQFMQFMQTMMQMFQQFQGGGGRGMGGGFQGPSPFKPQQQQYGQYQPRRMSNQFNSNNAFGGY
tara:strand:- start:1227 stop:1859 length:633 start_codon:yes stop_codon:yes gene_type:complete